MSHFIGSRLLDGNPVLINMDNAKTIQPADDDNTLITFIDGTSETIIDHFEVLLEMIQGKRD